MISAVDNNKNQYYEKVGAVQFQAQRGYSAAFQNDLFKRMEELSRPFDAGRVEKVNFLTYGKGNAKNVNPFEEAFQNGDYNLMHPNVKNENKAQKFDFIA